MIHIVSFGYLHGEAPEADFTIDARRLFRDPHVDPRLRELTGLDPLVQRKVRATPGVEGTVANTISLLLMLSARLDADITVAVGCAGGRHRSVVMANDIMAGVSPHRLTFTRHLHLDRPVVTR